MADWRCDGEDVVLCGMCCYCCVFVGMCCCCDHEVHGDIYGGLVELAVSMKCGRLQDGVGVVVLLS